MVDAFCGWISQVEYKQFFATNFGLTEATLKYLLVNESHASEKTSSYRIAGIRKSGFERSL